NASQHSENRMHSDEVARRFGFKGALVPGVTVFAHMTRPLVERYGERWLGGAIAEVSFARPAYEGDLLTVAPRTDANEAARPASPDARPNATDIELACRNEEGVELARMRSYLPQSRPAVDPRSDVAPAPSSGERPLATWELMEI